MKNPKCLITLSIVMVLVLTALIVGFTVAEVFGTANNSFKRHETVFNVGFRYDLGESNTLLASIGRSLHHAGDQPTLLSYLGLQLRF